ncbi:GFA family protein [Cochlodiniinecator piscidefendens]|uniref:GFA family protein n=1 Tax=Cochlodiniinecator piscidefendens TaxID=2715756 RepID=UPI00140A9677|nr:GFA family protein [Cochlodiniinecator piscidefendens]
MPHGQCDCGQVQFEFPKGREAITVCHCSQCRRLSGHLWASTHAPFDSVKFINQTGLKWYKSSEWAQRGFCQNCGSSLFYRLNSEDGLGIAAGCISSPTEFQVAKHIFVKDKGDYYEIADGAPQIDRY